MDLPADLTLVDLVVAAVVVVAATATWGPGAAERVARDTALLDVAPVPGRAQREANRLAGALAP